MSHSMFGEGCAIVIGGSGGIGAGICLEFARSGTNVAICYNSKKAAADELQTQITALGVSASVHKVDARDPASLKALFSDAARQHGRVHSMVWAAGPLVDQVLLQETSLEQYKRAIDIEVLGFFNASQSAIRHFREQGGGVILHLGSAGDSLWPARDGLSVAPKAANESLVRGIAKEEGRHEIRANSILVGVIEAGMFLELTKQGAFPQAWVDETQKMLCLKRWGKAEDIGAAAVFLCSDKAAYITGQQISVSGGFGV